ncbi:MAG: ATP-binding protein [Verrucomicrobiales bacterium]
MTDPPSAFAPPRRFFPLYGKILLWFFANVLLVGGAAFWLVREQFGLDRTLLLTRDGRARLQVRAEQTLDALETAGAGRSEADAILARLGEEENLSFALYDFGGGLVAGDPLPLPPVVRERLPIGRGRGGVPGRGREGQPPDGPPENGLRPGGPFPAPLDPAGSERPARGIEDGRRRDRGPGVGARADRGWRGDGRRADFPKEALRSDDPPRYWILARLPPVPEGPGRGRALVLVGMAESLGQSALLFDPKPWLFGGLALLGASALLWWPFVRGLTRSLAQMRGATERVAHGDFSVSVDDARGDELGRLGHAINAMTNRLAGHVSGQKRFLGDIAHELCSPLARMEMALGILEQRTPDDLRARVGDVREEVREMSGLVNELLAFTKAGLQESTAVRQPVALAPLIESVVAREGAADQVTVDVPADLSVLAAPALLNRALGNVLRNAVHYAGSRGSIEITAALPAADSGSSTEDRVVISIADHGPGVPAEALPKLFDPFFRVDAARTRETGGVGLGLAIVKSAVEACGGTVAARPRLDGQGGLVVDLTLPAAANGRRSSTRS